MRGISGLMAPSSSGSILAAVSSSTLWSDHQIGIASRGSPSPWTLREVLIHGTNKEKSKSETPDSSLKKPLAPPDGDVRGGPGKV